MSLRMSRSTVRSVLSADEYSISVQVGFLTAPAAMVERYCCTAFFLCIDAQKHDD